MTLEVNICNVLCYVCFATVFWTFFYLFCLWVIKSANSTVVKEKSYKLCYLLFAETHR